VTLSVFLTDTGELLDSDILFNGDDFKWTTASARGRGRGQDVQNAATHEIGHFLGISHSVRVPDSTMYPGTSAGELPEPSPTGGPLASSASRDKRDSGCDARGGGGAHQVSAPFSGLKFRDLRAQVHAVAPHIPTANAIETKVAQAK